MQHVWRTDAHTSGDQHPTRQTDTDTDTHARTYRERKTSRVSVPRYTPRAVSPRMYSPSPRVCYMAPGSHSVVITVPGPPESTLTGQLRGQTKQSGSPAAAAAFLLLLLLFFCNRTPTRFGTPSCCPPPLVKRAALADLAHHLQRLLPPSAGTLSRGLHRRRDTGWLASVRRTD